MILEGTGVLLIRLQVDAHDFFTKRALGGHCRYYTAGMIHWFRSGARRAVWLYPPS